MAELVLVALSLGLSNFPAAIAVGVEGRSRRKKIEVLVAFGAFETLMPVVGVLIGHLTSADLGHTASAVGGAILVALGVYALIQSRRPPTRAKAASASRRRLLLTAAALSLDNLAVGFVVGADHVALVLAVLVIGMVSVIMSAVGLEIGARLGTRFASRSEALGGVLLAGVGLALLANAS